MSADGWCTATACIRHQNPTCFWHAGVCRNVSPHARGRSPSQALTRGATCELKGRMPARNVLPYSLRSSFGFATCAVTARAWIGLCLSTSLHSGVNGRSSTHAIPPRRSRIPCPFIASRCWLSALHPCFRERCDSVRKTCRPWTDPQMKDLPPVICRAVRWGLDGLPNPISMEPSPGLPALPGGNRLVQLRTRAVLAVPYPMHPTAERRHLNGV